MKEFDIIFAADYPKHEFPIILRIENVPVDYFPHSAIFASPIEAKNDLMACLAGFTPDEVWTAEENLEFNGLFQAKARAHSDYHDEFYLTLVPGSVKELPIEFLKDGDGTRTS